MSYRSFISRLLLILAISIAYFANSHLVWAEALSDLPQKWRNTEGKWVLLDFYTPYCSTCRAFEPGLQAIQKELGAKVEFKRADMQIEKHRDLAELYDVDGTPTYILFDAAGHPVFRMKDYLSLEVLHRQLQRMTGFIKPVVLPSTLPESWRGADEKKHYKLLVLHKPGCKTCDELQPNLKAMAFALSENQNNQTLTNPKKQPPIDMIWLDYERPETQQWLSANKYKKSSQAYWLLDDENRELFMMPGNPTAQQLWKYIKLYTNSGV